VTNSLGETDSSGESGAALLKLLTAIEADSGITQRSAAREMGVALGLANAYVRRCVRKGWVKIHQVPANRYVYYLTPTGFAEKSRLTAVYLNQGFQFFRISRSQLNALFEQSWANGWQQIVLAGVSDLSEIAIMEARRHSITIVAVISPGSSEPEQDGVKVVDTIDEALPFDAIVVTDTSNPQQTFDTLCETMDGDRVMTPEILQITKRPVVSGLEQK